MRRNKGQIETRPTNNSPTQLHPVLNALLIFVPKDGLLLSFADEFNTW